MGRIVFLDTGFISAYINKADNKHKDAKDLIEQSLIKDPTIRFCYTDYIFDELITQLKSQKVHAEIIESIGDTLQKSKLWKMIKISENDFVKTWNMAKKYSDKEWSFTDMTSFVVMDTYKISLFLSYDRHFKEYPKIQQYTI